MSFIYTIFNTNSWLKIISENKQILKNFIHLIFVQGLGFLLPLLLYGYLIRIVGLDIFALFALSQSILTYLLVITDYGFNLSATKAIATNKDNIYYISQIVLSVYFIKIILILVSFMLYFIVVISIDKLYQHSFFFLSAYLIVIGKSLFPIWFFQGVEKMEFISILSTTGRLIIFILVVSFINSIESFMYLNLLYGLGELFIALCSIFILLYVSRLKFLIPSWTLIKEQFVEGWFIFASNFSINIYVNSNIPILAIFTTDYFVGVFGSVEKVIVALKQISNVLMQAIYPKACRLAEEAQAKLQNFMFNVFKLLLVGYTLISIILLFGADLLILFYKGESNPDMILMIRLLSFLPLIVALNMPAYQVMVINSLHKSYVSILVIGAILNTILAFILSYYFQHIGIALTMIIVEIFITLCLHLLLITKHKEYSIFTLKNI